MAEGQKHEELKPCPFCGGEAKSHKTDIGPGYQTSSVKCKRCPAEVAKSGLDAEAAWNRRADGVAAKAISGWRLYSADFSIDGRKGSVTLIRDSEGHKWWDSLSDAEKEETDLFVTGFANTIEEAVIDANAKAKPAAGAA